MSLTSAQIIAEEYFTSLNPIAERISSDVAATKDAYENLWHTLSVKDQSQVIDETIIHPEAVLKYSFYPQNEPEIEYFPKLRLQTGDKYVIDDDSGKGSGLTWRDEHSAPFSWMTRSQLNLSVFDDDKMQKTKLNAPSSIQTKQKSATPSKKLHLHPCTDSFVDPPSIVLGGSSSKLAAPLNSKVKFPPKCSNGEDANLLTKIRNKTAVLKIQSLKSAVSKSGNINCNRKEDEGEKETLMKHRSNCTVVPGSSLAKPPCNKPVISKPKTPPPPPPSRPRVSSVPNCHLDPERKALLEVAPAEEVEIPKKAVQIAPCESISQDNLQDFHIELTVSDEVPKTGFDFLDNW